MSETDALLTPTEAAQRLGVAISTLVYWRMKHAGPRYVRFGDGAGRVRYQLADLDAYVAAKVVDPVNA